MFFYRKQYFLAHLQKVSEEDVHYPDHYLGRLWPSVRLGESLHKWKYIFSI